MSKNKKITKNKAKTKKKLIIDKQKMFWAISLAVLAACLLFYGIRLIYYHHKFNGNADNSNTIYKTVVANNHDDNALTNIGDNYYFVGKDVNNYVEYSNIMFRIIRLNANGTITLVADHALSNLSMGENKEFSKSYIYDWLNKKEDTDNTGILEQSLNVPSKYLFKSLTCTDKLDSANNKECQKDEISSYLTLLSVADYINTGNIDSFANNGQYFYLSNNTKDNASWYVNSTGKIGTIDGSDIYGVRPVITLAKDLELVSGTGTATDPYKIEKNTGKFGSYVKLGNDIWRIYQVEDNNYKLVLNDYLTVDSQKLESNYSNKTYKYNDTESGSLAHYLNKTYLNSLSYKDLIIDSKYSNGYYTKEDYRDSFNTMVETKVGLLGVGNIILNNTLDEYYTSTGNISEGKMVYVIKNNGHLVTKSIRSTAYVVPCITIDKNTLTKGEGTITSPYETE